MRRPLLPRDALSHKAATGEARQDLEQQSRKQMVWQTGHGVQLPRKPGKATLGYERKNVRKASYTGVTTAPRSNPWHDNGQASNI